MDRRILMFIGAAATGAALLLPGMALAAGGDAGDGAVPWVKVGLHAFNLTVLFGAIAYFAGPKVKEALKTRAAEIKAEIDASNQARKDTRERFEALEARLDAAAEADKEAAAIAARADKDIQRIQEATERSIRNETAKARLALRADAVALAVKLAEERLTDQLGTEDDQRLAGDLLSLVEDGDAANSTSGVTHG